MREKLLYQLRTRQKNPLPRGDFIPAAVLVPLFIKNGDTQILFTQRSMQVQDHKGQISFPGGRWEESDKSLLDTALRETEEELGIAPKQVEILGELGEWITPSRYHITPFVGIIPYPCVYRLNAEEISEIIEVPLVHLLEPKNLRLERGEFFNQQSEMPYFQFGPHVIWGATARITRELVDLIKDSGLR